MKARISGLGAVLLACVVALHGSVVAADTNLRYASNHWPSGAPVEFQFPLVELPDAEASRVVNLYLHHLALNMLPPVLGTEEARGERLIRISTPATLSLISLKATPRQMYYGDRVLTVQTSIEGCDSYCYAYEHQHAFDARTGRLLVMPEILTPQGVKALGLLSAATHRAKFQTALSAVKRKLRTAPKSGHEREKLDGQQDMYTECLTSFSGSGYGTKTPGDMAFTGNGLVFSRGPCSPHVSRAWDEVGELTYAVNSETLAPHLTPYGRALILQEGDARPDGVNPLLQVFEGFIGERIPVTVFLDRRSIFTDRGGAPVVHAVYYYNRYRRPISLRVEKSTTGWQMTEDSVVPERTGANLENVKDPAVLEVTLRGRELVEHWTAKGRRSAFKASAVGE